MDRSLDEIISERPKGPRKQVRRPAPPRGPRREEYPRDGVRKNRRDDRANLDTDWIHDRYEQDRHHDDDEYDDRYDDDRRAGPRGPDRHAARAADRGSKLRADDLHYDVTEDDVHELFSRIGPILSAKLTYDRAGRSKGTAFVTYADARDAKEAVREFDGANAYGQPIRVALLPDRPARDSRGGSLFDRIERPSRSLFERVESGRDDGRARRGRSFSPRRGDRENVDSYVPQRHHSRSPMKPRGGPRERGRRPGARREESGRGAAPRKPRVDDAGRPIVGGRPKKTAEELDAEMADYWGTTDDGNTAAALTGQSNGGAAAATTTAAGDDVDMIE